ncbi:MAG: response regulator transcription factor [Flavihumibacter sp.]
MKPYTHILLYGSLLAVLVFLLKWLQWKFLVADNAIEIYVGLVAVLFTALGGWLASRLISGRVQTVVIEKEVVRTVPASDTIDEERKKLQLSTREYEVLELLTKGHSNAEIAEQLFVSLSTVKTHVSNILFKMDVKSRAKAIEKAKRLKITP